MSGVGKVVCVTGASGYLASWLVKLLLQHGYTVNATVRDPCDLEKTDHLVALDGAKERLHLFKASLMEEGSFDYAISGCDGVFHTASPVFHPTNDPQVELIDPAVKGTLNVLRSCAKAPSVRRVVITSSIVSVVESEKALIPGVVVDETWFSDISFCEKTKRWYSLSKTLAENAAWKFAKENGMDLVTIHPGFVIGPLIQSSSRTTAKLILDLLSGSQTCPNQVMSFIDVRDVANAHIQAFEVASASGRFLVAGPVLHLLESLKMIQCLYPSLTIPDKCEDNGTLIPKFQVSNLKAKSLGIINFIPMEVSLRDTMESFKEKGLLNI